jgi:cytochrome c-type biogenesis protein CcmH
MRQSGADPPMAAFTPPLRPLAERGLALGALAASAWLFASMGALAPAEAGAESHDLPAMAARLESRLTSHPAGAAAADASTWALLARSHAALGQGARAESAYERALGLDPNDAALWAERAQVRVLQGARADHTSVQSLATRALALDAAQPLALALAGDAAFERGELAAARARWQSAAVHAQGDAELAAALTRRLAQLDAAERALPAFTR